MLFTEYYQEFWPLQKLYINQFCFYRPNLFFPQVLSLSVSDLKRVRSAKQWNPLIDLRPMAVELIFVVKMHAACYRCITLCCSSSVCPSPDTILLFFFFLFSFFFFFMFWNKRLYWALWHIFWSYYQGKQENSGRVIYQTSSFVIHWLLCNTHGSS